MRKSIKYKMCIFNLAFCCLWKQYRLVRLMRGNAWFMINIYCDESCHLEHDKAKAMLLGAISCSESEKSRIYSEIRAIKERHSLSTWNEIKWTSVSPSKLSFYIEIIDYFINEPALSFRAVVAKDMSPKPSIFNQSSKDFLEMRIMLPMRIVLNNPEFASL